MPAWEDYKKASRERGSLAMELFVVESTPQVPGPQLQEVLPDHLAYQKELEAAGTLFLAGPLSDATGEQMEGAGMMIYRAESIEAANAHAQADPMHAQGARTFTLRKWLVNEGSFDLSISLSRQGVTFK